MDFDSGAAIGILNMVYFSANNLDDKHVLDLMEIIVGYCFEKCV